MIDCKAFYSALTQHGVGFYAGVPDSLLANFCAYVDDHGGSEQHLITANEGNAVALAMGYHMACKKVAAVYLQNSGLGNIINPLTSLADPEVYRVPLLLLVGWRGEPGVKDEPQHVKQGRITLEQLDVLGIPYWILDADSDYYQILKDAFSTMSKQNAPVALVIRKDSFAKYKSTREEVCLSQMSREDGLRRILELSQPSDLIVSTTGKTSREVFELRVQREEKQRDFLTVGGMGHTASIALGVAIGQPNRQVIALDGDGSMIMHMGALAVIAEYAPKNFLHVLLNNGAHESVGGQATAAQNIDIEQLVLAVGYKHYACATDSASLDTAWAKLAEVEGPKLLELKIRCGSREDLGRPTSTAEQNKLAFMDFIHGK
jgi:phosphonopyruvate decarboxylase